MEMFWLKKVVGFWLMPLPLSLALIIAGVILLRFMNRRRLGRSLTLAGVIWLLICSNVGVGTLLVRSLENRFPPISELSETSSPPTALTRCRFVAVLGGGHNYVEGRSANNQLSTSALERIVEAVRIAHRLPLTRLVVSGPADPRGGPSHAHLLADTAVALGVGRERIIEIDTARDTENEAVALRVIAGDAPVALVTSAGHMPRAMALCRHQQLNVQACPTDYNARPGSVNPLEFIQWNIGGLERSTKAFYEFLGLTWARVRNKI